MSEYDFEMYTDGACKGNPGPGGYCAILLAWNNQTHQLVGEPRIIRGGEEVTTNNIMELRGVIEGLRALNRPDVHITIVTDSTYVRNGITQWIHNWKRNGWRTSKKQPVKNADLWRELDSLVNQHQVSWRWTKGHASDEWNNQADKIASEEAKKRL